MVAYLAYTCSLYQEHIGKNLTDKYGKLSKAMDKLVNEANSEISALQHSIECKRHTTVCGHEH